MNVRIPALALAVLGFSPAAAAQGTERFDLATFTLPAEWTREETRSAVRLTLTTPADRSYCQVNIYRGVPGTGDPRADFAKDWAELVSRPFGISAGPAAWTGIAISGWSHHAGRATYVHSGQTTSVSLTTYSAPGTAVSVLTLANHEKCEALMQRVVAGTTLRRSGSAPGGVGSPVAVPAAPSAFQYTTSSFDDGWRATAQADWVLVEKGGIRVYLHYAVPYEASRFSGTGLMDRDHYWNEVVGRQFQAAAASYRDDGEVVGSLKPKYVEGWGVDRASGERRFLAMVLAVAPNAAQVTLASAPDEESMRRAFPKANDRWSSDLAAMSRFNKFAVGPRDLVGTWQSGGSQTTQWYDARTGAYAGATLAASSATFTFAADGTYRSVHNGATGAVGAMSTFQQEYAGKYQVANWAVTATNRWKGETHGFDAHFQAVRGGRLLHLDDGRGGSYLLVRTGR